MSDFIASGSAKSTLLMRSTNAWKFWTLVILSVLLSNAPFFSLIFAPVNTFVTMIHEMGHAVVCIATGGTVHGMTIVADGAGHGGLTFCYGGNPFLYTQSGYLGAALVGCVLIYLGQFTSLSKLLLTAIGLSMISATFMLESKTLFAPGFFLQGLGSIAWSSVIGGALIFCGIKWKATNANLLLLFLGVQTALNSLTDVRNLVEMTFGGSPVLSDAANMAAITPIPALVWSLWWAFLSIAMLGTTLWLTYGKRAIKG
jgi:hypothetical protein